MADHKYNGDNFDKNVNFVEERINKRRKKLDKQLKDESRKNLQNSHQKYVIELGNYKKECFRLKSVRDIK